MLLPHVISGGSCSSSPSVLDPRGRFYGRKCLHNHCSFAGSVCFFSRSPPSPAAWTRCHLATRLWPTPCEPCRHAWYTAALPWLCPWCLNGRAAEGNSVRARLLPVSVTACPWYPGPRPLTRSILCQVTGWAGRGVFVPKAGTRHCSLPHPSHTVPRLRHRWLRGFLAQSFLSMSAARAQNLLCRSELQAEQEPSSWCWSSEAPRLCCTLRLHVQLDKLRLCLLLLL